MYSLNDIRRVHLEISSECNAMCPQCPRNFYGYPYNDGYTEHSMTLAEAKKIFKPSFLKQLHQININGNFGDAVMNPDTVDIVEYFKQHLNESGVIIISTNGGARNQEFWSRLAELNTIVHFCIDGLEDTHSIYRRNTMYSTVINNAKTFINAGGNAVWKMIKFDHNLHQIDKARELSVELNFKEFALMDHGRNTGPVYNNKKQVVFVMGTPTVTNFDELFNSRHNSTMPSNVKEWHEPIKTSITCEAVQNKSIYITSVGEVYPCCYLGFAPKTYGSGSHNYMNIVNTQLRPLLNNNNALEYSLEQCMSWFNKVEESWQMPTYGEGRLVACNNMCGKD